MKIVALICRMLLGLMFVVFGANGLHHFMPMPAPVPGSLKGDWIIIMLHCGWMQHVAALQVLGGILVLVGGTAPLGLCILGPILVNILIFHMTLEGGHGIGMGLFAALLEVVLIYAYRANFSGIFTTKARPV